DRALDLGEWRGRKLVLELREVCHGLLTDEVGTGRECLAKLDGGRTDRDQCCSVVGRGRDSRSKPRNSHEASHRRRSERVFLDAAQCAVPSERPAPFQQTPQVGYGGGQIFQPEWIVTNPP